MAIPGLTAVMDEDEEDEEEDSDVDPGEPAEVDTSRCRKCGKLLRSSTIRDTPMCDKCDHSFHFQCARDYHPETVEDDGWICQFCSWKARKEGGSKGEDEDDDDDEQGESNDGKDDDEEEEGEEGEEEDEEEAEEEDEDDDAAAVAAAAAAPAPRRRGRPPGSKNRKVRWGRRGGGHFKQNNHQSPSLLLHFGMPSPAIRHARLRRADCSFFGRASGNVVAAHPASASCLSIALCLRQHSFKS